MDVGADVENGKVIVTVGSKRYVFPRLSCDKDNPYNPLKELRTKLIRPRINSHLNTLIKEIDSELFYQHGYKLKHVHVNKILDYRKRGDVLNYLALECICQKSIIFVVFNMTNKGQIFIRTNHICSIEDFVCCIYYNTHWCSWLAYDKKRKYPYCVSVFNIDSPQSDIEKYVQEVCIYDVDLQYLHMNESTVYRSDTVQCSIRTFCESKKRFTSVYSGTHPRHTYHID
ncbi:MAG: hypothetical protein GY804_08840 [Alphaproteobacteria bacterium]|nr:hypothetical protein [Alphaproteobacteria bacterium]